MDAAAFGADVVAAVRSFLEQEIDPLHARIAELEKHLAEIPVPKDGKDGADGRSITLEDVAPLILSEVEKAVAAIPPAKDGQNGKDADPELIKTMIADAMAALPPAEGGKDADPELVASLVREEAERILAAWEQPKNGVDGKDGAPGADGKDGAPGKDGLDGKDGRNGLDAVKFFRDDKGHLIVVKSDGSTDDLGEYVGKDGAPGKDGVDGVGFDDMSCEVRDDGVYLVWEKGDVIKEARLPVPVYRGVFKEGTAYLAGDNVSFGGSVFIAERATSAKPETPDSGWRLSVKRGRDGKDAVPVKPKKVA
jgi:hypothetical protein